MELGEISIPLNFQCSDVADLTNIVCNYSFTIKLPLTNLNKLYTDNSQELSNVSTFPFEFHEARYYIEGLPIFEKGQNRILKINDSIEIALSFGNYELLGTIEKLKLKDLTLTDVLNWNYNLSGSTNAGFGIGQFGDTIVNGKLYPQRVVPFVKAKNLFDIIVGSYEMPTDIANHLSGLVLPLTTKNSELQYLNDVISTVSLNGTFIMFASGQTGSQSWVTFFNTYIEVSDLYDNTFILSTQRYFIIPITGFYSISFDYYFNDDFLGTTGIIEIIDSLTNDVLGALNWTMGPTNHNRTISIKLNEGSIIYFKMNANQLFTQTTPVILVSSALKVEFDTNNPDNDFSKTGFKLKYPVKNNLPDVSQKDFIKSIMQLYGLMMQIIDNKPSFFTFNEVYANFANAFDWSENLVQETRNSSNIDFSSDIAEKNLLKWKEDNTVTSGYGDAIIPAVNQFLKERIILTNQMYAASESTTEVDLSGNIWGMCKFSLFEKQENGKYKTTNIKQRICMGIDKNMNLSVQSVFGEATGISSGAVQRKVYCFEGSNMTYDELVSLYWNKYSEIMNKFKQTKLKFILTPVQISQFRFDRPVYLKQYARYFFVKRINNWEANKIVEVDLIVL